MMSISNLKNRKWGGCSSGGRAGPLLTSLQTVAARAQVTKVSLGKILNTLSWSVNVRKYIDRKSAYVTV